MPLTTQRAERESLSRATSGARSPYAAALGVGFLPDARRYGVTFFNTVGRALKPHSLDARD